MKPNKPIVNHGYRRVTPPSLVAECFAQHDLLHCSAERVSCGRFVAIEHGHRNREFSLLHGFFHDFFVHVYQRVMEVAYETTDSPMISMDMSMVSGEDFLIL